MMKTKQKTAAEEIAVSEGYLSRVLSGQRNFSPTKARQVSKATSSPLEIWLFNTKKNISARKKAIKCLAAKQVVNVGQ